MKQEKKGWNYPLLIILILITIVMFTAAMIGPVGASGSEPEAVYVDLLDQEFIFIACGSGLHRGDLKIERIGTNIFFGQCVITATADQK